MHPSSSSSASSFDPNAPYRAAIESLVHCNFFTDTSPSEIAAAVMLPPPFVELNPRPLAHMNTTHHCPMMAQEPPPASVTVSTLRQYLLAIGRATNSNMVDATIQNRLDAGHISAQTLLLALQTAHAADHPIWQSLQAKKRERQIVLTRLAGIVSHSAGFNPTTKACVQQSQNDAFQLIRLMLCYLRDHHC